MSALRICYHTYEFGGMDIHVRTLRDRREYLDTDGVAEKLGISSAAWPIFGVVWASGVILANYMVDFQVAGKRILEVGCGIALATLVLNGRNADVTATDYHPEAETFLLENIKLNKGIPIPFICTGWGDPNAGMGDFDLIIGSDLLYEQGHAELLAGFIDQHAKAQCEVVIVDPGRGMLNRFSRIMTGFGYASFEHQPSNTNDTNPPFKGSILRYVR